MNVVKVLLCLTISLSAWSYTVRFASLDWKPYIGKDLKHHGLIAQIVKMAYESQGHTVKISFLPWARALAMTKSGHFDGLLPEYFDEQRLTDFIFSDKIIDGPVGFCVRKGTKLNFNGDYNSLRGLKIGLVRGYLNTPKLDQATFLTKEFATNDHQNLRKLSSSRLDLVFIDKYVASHIMREDPSIKEVEFLNPGVENKGIYIAFSKNAVDSERRLRDFNLGLKKIRPKVLKLLEGVSL